MTKIVKILFLAMLTLPLGAQMPDNGCCELSAKVDAAQGDDSPVILNLAVKNVAADSVLVVWGNSDDILFSVLKADGQEAERTERGNVCSQKSAVGVREWRNWAGAKALNKPSTLLRFTSSRLELTSSLFGELS
jgi:hypothetical protein